MCDLLMPCSSVVAPMFCTNVWTASSEARSRNQASRANDSLPAASFRLLPWLTFQPWRMRHYVPPKRQWATELHGVSSEKVALFIVTGGTTSYPTTYSKRCTYSHMSRQSSHSALRRSCMRSKRIHRRRTRIIGTSTLAFRSRSRAVRVCVCVWVWDRGPRGVSRVRKLPGGAGHLSEGEAAVPRPPAWRGQKHKRERNCQSTTYVYLWLGVGSLRNIGIFLRDCTASHSELHSNTAKTLNFTKYA